MPAAIGRIKTRLKGVEMSKTKGNSAAMMPASQPVRNQPTREEIALRAYQIYLERGMSEGNEFSDWILAERELSERASKPRRRAARVAVA
jgi:hypothetical protein